MPNTRRSYAEKESGIPAATIVKIAREIARAGSSFAAHIWRGTASGNFGGWNVARCLEFLHVLTGSVGTQRRSASEYMDKIQSQILA